MPDLSDPLARLIAAAGPISVARYMAEANAAYYAAADPLGAGGDFTTAPEISQMFGELIGLWLADLWQRAGRPADVHYVELGPGRGTLAADALRAMRGAGLAPPIDLVEMSPALRQAQAARLPSARWHDDIDSLRTDAPLLIVANEFFDALPIRQIVRAPDGWRELVVDHREGRFVRCPGPRTAAPDRDAPEGTIIEAAPAAAASVGALAALLAAQGGAALIIDYGPAGPAQGDTLQAVSRHRFADPWEKPGTRDLTAHVDFEDFGRIARRARLRVAGPCAQGSWLSAIGIDLRAAALAKAAPERASEIAAARDRLVKPDAMGDLFKVLALTAPSWPEPGGF